MALDIVLLQGPRRGVFLVSDVLLYMGCVLTPDTHCPYRRISLVRKRPPHPTVA